MAIDKSIDYVEQDGYKNYIKNSKSVTVPKEFKSRSDATPTKLAYITKDEAKMLKKMKKNTPHKGPSGVPSYDDYDAETGSFRSGAAMSAAETGGRTERSRADMRAAGIGPQEAQDLRSAAIAAGAGQRVNPGFFDSRNTVSPAELARARAFNPTAFRQNRGGGILNFITSGGLLGNLARGLGQRLGLGKRFNEPTYDMSQFSDLGLLTDRVTPSYYNDLDNEGLLSLITDKKNTTLRRNPDDDYLGSNLNEGIFMDYQELDESEIGSKPKLGGTVLDDELIPGTKSDDNRVLPKNLDLGLPNDLYAEIKPNTLKQLKNMGIFKEGQKSPYTDKDELRMLVPSLNNATDKELDQIIQGTYTT